MITFRQNRSTKARDRERGVALVAALLTLLLIGAITAGMIILSNTETNTSANFRDEQTALFSAKGGMEEVRDRLRTGATDTLRTVGILPTTLPGTAGSVLYVLNPANGEADAPWGANYPDDEICKESTTIACAANASGVLLPTGAGWYTSQPASAAYAVAPVLDWKWVRITLKQSNTIAPYYTNGSNGSTAQVFWNGTNECIATSPACTPPVLPVYVMTSLAVTPGRSRRMVQAEVAENLLNFQAPSPLTLDGTGDTFDGGHSAQFGSDGHDHPGCGFPASTKVLPGVGVTDPADIAAVAAGIPTNRDHNYIGSGGTPDVQNIGPTLPPNLQTVSSLQNLVSTIKSNVTQPVINGPASGLSNAGTSTAPQIIYVNGDLTISGNTTGYGILLVTGTFTAKGSSGWNGIVLVVGKGNAQLDGNTSFNGAIVVANTVDALGNPLPVLGPTTFSVNGGGNGGINYSSGCITQASTLSTFHIMAVRELMN